MSGNSASISHQISSPGGEDTVRIGILHSRTGSMAFSELPLIEAALMAIAQINETGGVLGKRLEPVIEDGASDPAIFTEKASKLICGHGAVTLFGCWTSAARKAVQPVLEAQNVLLWYPVQYEGLEASKNIFYTGACANQQVEPALDWLLQQGKQRLYLLGSEYVFPYTANRIVKAQWKHRGGEVVGETYLPLAATDFSQAIAAIRQAKPDAVFSTLNGESNLHFYQQYRAAGITPEQIPVMAVSVSETELQHIGAAAAGHYASWSYFQSLDTPGNREFVRQFRDRYGASRVTSDPVEAAYTQVFLWKQAVELAQSFESDRVRLGAIGQSFQAPGGVVRVEPNHHVWKDNYIGRILPDGQFEVVSASEQPIKPMPWLGVEEAEFRGSEIVIDLLAEVSHWVERTHTLEQKSQELEATMARLQAEMQERERVEVALRRSEAQLQRAYEDLEHCVEERTAALREANDNLVMEIVEHRYTETALQAAKDRLEALLEAVPGIVSWIDSDLHYLGVNRRLADMFQLPPNAFVGKRVGFLSAGMEFQQFARQLFDSPAKDAYREISATVNGELRHYLIVAQKYDSAPAGRQDGFAGRQNGTSTARHNGDRAAFVIGIDITERYRAKEALQGMQDRFETVLEVIPGIVSWIGSDLRYLGVNHHLADIFNLPPESFVGRHIGFLGSSSEFIDFARELFANGDRDGSREIASIVNGQTRNYLILARKYDRDRAAFVVGIDITQRRQAEAELKAARNQLEAILAAVPGIVSWISADLRYLGVNRQLADMFNLTPDAFVGRDIGFLSTSSEFIDFVRELFQRPETEACREISAYIGGTLHNYLIVAQKYEDSGAAFVVGIDVTDRRLAEAALRDAEAKYRSIFENATEGIFQTSLDGRYLSVNPALAKIYGYDSPQELIESITNVATQLYVNPARREEFVRLFAAAPMSEAEERRAAAAGESVLDDAVVGFESQVYRKDGSIIWIVENARAVRDAEGNLLYYEGTVEDISDRKQAQAALQAAKQELEMRVEERTAALQQSNHRLVKEIEQRQRIEDVLREAEEELRALLAAMTDMIVVFDARGRYLKVISTNPKLFYTADGSLTNPSDRIGLTVHDVLPPDLANLFTIHIQRALNTGATASLEYRLPLPWDEERERGREGEKRDPSQAEQIEATTNVYYKIKERWFSANVSPMADNTVIWVARDITDRKQAEENLRQAESKYRSIFENATEGIYQTTPDGTYLSANPALAKIYGYDSPEQLMAELTDIARQLYVNPKCRQQFITALATEEALNHFEAQVYRRDGSIIWTSENARAVRAEGDILYYEGTVVDVTARKQAEEALRAEQIRSERLLLNILPQSIAEQLKRHEGSLAERYEEATVLFADIVGFTSLSSHVSPLELVDLLNQIFSAFDRLTEQHGLEKIKTIGDAYMAVGGLPTPRPDHREAIADMALQMCSEVSRFKRVDGQPFQLRIGIHTGPVVAGVIGIKKFIYDLWGDTVNVASRMESQGEADRIQVTAETYEHLKEKFNFERRGTIEVKGKGEMTTYWLQGRR